MTQTAKKHRMDGGTVVFLCDTCDQDARLHVQERKRRAIYCRAHAGRAVTSDPRHTQILGVLA